MHIHTPSLVTHPLMECVVGHVWGALRKPTPICKQKRSQPGFEAGLSVEEMLITTPPCSPPTNPQQYCYQE